MHRPISRRVFLTKAGGLTLSIGLASLWRPRAASARNPYDGGVWLAGDHHIHTKYSPDGMYEIIQQVDAAQRHGLSWCVITDHGGPKHDKIAVEDAYPELLAARKKHSSMTIFQGLEWNVPAAEHGTVIVPPSPDEARVIAEFEALYDELNESRPGTPANTEAEAVAAVKYLETLKPSPLFFANHPARRGRNSPMEMRAWGDAGPNVMRGFEAAAGHQAATLTGHIRGHYEKGPKNDSWPGYPLDSYRTWCGYDWYVAKVGGLWDSLLGEGRPWYITADSDSHRHWTEHHKVDDKTYKTLGHVTTLQEELKPTDKTDNIDFWPGEYTKTWAYADSPDPLAIMKALRSGSMFPVHGDLIDRLELTATSADAAAPMGGMLLLDRPGQDVTLQIRVREPHRPNFAGRAMKVHHVDLITGEINGPLKDRAIIENPTARVAQRFEAKDARREGDWLSFSHRFPGVRTPFYVRVRGTNRDLLEPQIDDLKINPWDDLWFYSNPILIRIK
ncbi:MAG TPA: PHP domain-containing protein [Phycisphaerae bacterium]|nr:PHP domain-containing protein [Phycisphaerae bacterium]